MILHFFFFYLANKRKRNGRKEKENPAIVHNSFAVVWVVLRTISYARYCVTHMLAQLTFCHSEALVEESQNKVHVDISPARRGKIRTFQLFNHSTKIAKPVVPTSQLYTFTPPQ